MKSVSIVIPAYNEAERLESALRSLTSYLEEKVHSSEIIVVDDGSEDGTASLTESFVNGSNRSRVKLIRNGINRGKGYSVRKGLLASSCDIALFSDADLATPITELPKVVDPIEEDLCDVAFGSRAIERELIGVRQTWRREQTGKIFNLAVRAATGLPIWDTQCGFKAFSMDICRPLIAGATIDGYAFDVELLLLAHLAGLRLKEIPVRWDHNTGSKVSVFRDSKRMLREVHRIRRQAQKGKYSGAINEVHRAVDSAKKARSRP